MTRPPKHELSQGTTGAGKSSGAAYCLECAEQDLLTAAADLVERVGLWQGGGYWPGSAEHPGVYCDPDPVDLIGALFVAAGLGESHHDVDASGRVMGRTARSVVALGGAWQSVARWLGTHDVQEWSDTPGRSVAEVATVLRGCKAANRRRVTSC